MQHPWPLQSPVFPLSTHINSTTASGLCPTQFHRAHSTTQSTTQNGATTPLFSLFSYLTNLKIIFVIKSVIMVKCLSCSNIFVYLAGGDVVECFFLVVVWLLNSGLVFHTVKPRGDTSVAFLSTGLTSASRQTSATEYTVRPGRNNTRATALESSALFRCVQSAQVVLTLPL